VGLSALAADEIRPGLRRPKLRYRPPDAPHFTICPSWPAPSEHLDRRGGIRSQTRTPTRAAMLCGWHCGSEAYRVPAARTSPYARTDGRHQLRGPPREELGSQARTPNGECRAVGAARLTVSLVTITNPPTLFLLARARSLLSDDHVLDLLVGCVGNDFPLVELVLRLVGPPRDNLRRVCVADSR